MNRYGEMARSHWQAWLPDRYAAISDPDSFFSAIGEEAERQIDELADQLAGPGQPGEGYLERAGKLTAARSRAEEIILPQTVLPEPEDTQDEPFHACQTKSPLRVFSAVSASFAYAISVGSG